MRIEDLRIRNLGRHKNLHAVLDGPVVGLLGKNGSGKSTILRIIQFLFTGYTPPKETQDSFIRRVDPDLEEQPEWGDAEMKFSSQGARCVLYKRIGVGASRRFEVDDKVYTRSDDIQSALTDILGADKYAIDNAVFPAQGELSKILFGGQADREELLVKLLLLGHMQKVADTAAAKIKILGAEIQDFSVLHDELQTSRRIAEEEFGKLSSRLDQAACYDEEIKQFRKYNELEKELVQVSDTLRRKQTEIAQYNDEIATILTSTGGQFHISIPSYADLTSRLEKVDSKIKSEQAKKDDLLKLKASSTLYLDLHHRYHTLLGERADLIMRTPAEPSQQKLDALRDKLHNQQYRDQLKLNLKADETALASTEQILTTSKRSQKAAADKELKISAEVQAETSKLDLYGTIVDTCALALRKASSAECPVCGSELIDVDLRKRHDQYADLQQTQKRLVAQLTSAWQAAAKLRSEYDMAISNCEQSITRLTENIQKYNNTLNMGLDSDTVAVQVEIDELTAQFNKYNTALALLSEADKTRAEMEKSLAAYSEEEQKVYLSDLSDIDNNIARIDSNLTSWEPIRKTLYNVDRTVSSYLSLIASSKKDMEDSQSRIHELKLSTGECVRTFTPRLKSIVSHSTGDPSAIEAELNNKNTEYTELRVKTEQMKIQAQGLKKRLLEIEQKIELDAHKRAVIVDLQKIVAAFSRQGIPMAYVQHKFDSLVAMTQENLEVMDANFAILPHTTRPVSLQFYRVDEPGQVLFDHEKLSGGQKVRLSVAFLLAVQQLVIPDLGFLVLDEPSTHLDEESRENLKDLLLNLGQQLETTDTQILVCDHAHELQPAFFNTIEL